MWGTTVLEAWGCSRWRHVNGLHHDEDDNCQNKLPKNCLKMNCKQNIQNCQSSNNSENGHLNRFCLNVLKESKYGKLNSTCMRLDNHS